MADEKLFARITGYTIILLFVCMLGFTIATIVNHFAVHNKTITVYFPKVGELKVEQPFMLNGFPIGTILSTSENVYNGVAVTVVLTRNITIRQGYQIYCSDVGLFGTKREIVLINGPESAEKVKDVNSLKGSYYIGMTEVISSVGKLQSAMTTVSRLFRAHLSGDSKALRLITAIENMSSESSKISNKLSEINEIIGVSIPAGVDKVENLVDTTMQLSRKFDRSIPEFRKDLESIIITVDSALEKIPDLIDQLESTADKLDSFDKKESLNALTKELKSIQKKFDYVRETAHKLLLFLRKYE